MKIYALFILIFFSTIFLVLGQNQEQLDEQMDLAYGKFLRSEFKSAIEDFTKIISEHPRSEEAYFLRGLCHSNLRDEVKAINDFSEAIKIKADYKEAFVERAYSKTNLDLLDEALLDYDAAIAVDPEYAEAYFNRATLYFEMDLDDKACLDWKKSMDLGIKVAEKVLEQYCSNCKNTPRSH
jgi:tetratricopeptide (TPR) repeat protein